MRFVLGLARRGARALRWVAGLVLHNGSRAKWSSLPGDVGGVDAG